MHLYTSSLSSPSIRVDNTEFPDSLAIHTYSPIASSIVRTELKSKSNICVWACVCVRVCARVCALAKIFIVENVSSTL